MRSYPKPRGLRLGLGGFPSGSGMLPVVGETEELHLTPSLAELMLMAPQSLEAEMSNWEKLDGVVWRLSGEDVLAFIWQLKLSGLLRRFENRTFFAAFWTMDSHHMLAREKAAAKFFDHVFVAHASYLSSFDFRFATLLPCSFSLAPTSVVHREITASKSKLSGPKIGAYFANYPGQRRNTEYFEIRNRLGRMGVSNFFGVARGGAYANEGLIQSSLKHDVILNLSLKDDLNMRNFEALGLNKILLTNKVPGHEVLESFTHNIVFFDRDLQDLESKVSQALATEAQDVSAEFLQRHHITNRIEEIVQTLRAKIGHGTQGSPKHSVAPSVTDFAYFNPTTFSVSEYGRAELFKTGGFNSLALRHIVNLARYGLKEMPGAVFGAVTYGLLSLIGLTLGRASLLRTLIRVFTHATQKRIN